jgi:hypothetical protein
MYVMQSSREMALILSFLAKYAMHCQLGPQGKCTVSSATVFIVITGILMSRLLQFH